MKEKKLPAEELALLYKQGLSCSQIGAKYNVSAQTVGRRLRTLDITIRRCGEWKVPVRRAEIDEEVLREKAGTLSTAELGQIFGCSEEAIRRRMVKLGIPRLPAKARPSCNHFWKGGRVVDKDGYVLLHAPEHPFSTKAGYVREHRLVMEAVIGRYLAPQEVVDHRNGQKSDNRPSNLRLFGSNAEHLRATLKGRVPNWTPEGFARLPKSLQRASRRASPNLEA